jgi:hypothetical protein
VLQQWRLSASGQLDGMEVKGQLGEAIDVSRAQTAGFRGWGRADARLVSQSKAWDK